MSTDLVQLYPDASVREAVETFEEYRISGAPVVDTGGEIVGVLTTSDIVRSGRLHEAEGGQLEYSGPPHPIRALALEEGGSCTKEDYCIELLNREVVGDWMTPEITAGQPTDSLLEVCSIMARDCIHRVFVTEGRKLVGVISTFDVVGHLSGSLQP